MIFEQLSFTDLFSVVRTYDDFLRGHAVWAFRRSQVHKQFVVCGSAYTYWSHGAILEENKTTVQIKDYKTVETILKTFGGSFKQLHMNYKGVNLYNAGNPWSDQCLHMNRWISEMAVNLTEFQVTCNDQMYYDYMMPKSKLPNVETLKFSFCHLHKGQYLKIDEKFPAVRSLHLKTLHVHTFNCLIDIFPTWKNLNSTVLNILTTILNL